MRSEMSVIDKSSFFNFINIPTSHLHVQPKGNSRKCTVTLLAKKRDLSENSRTQQQQPISQLRVPNIILARTVVAVFGLGFIDAGYSGDWSRIGVISKESEELLKIAAFVVIPLCIFLIFSISKEAEA